MTPHDLARRIAADREGAGLFLDFDGTLTAIVDDPATSAIDLGTRQLLGHLAHRLRVVAVVSGRPASFLLERAAAPGVRLLGLYGLEEADDRGVTPRPELAQWQPAVDRALKQLHDEFDGRDGLMVEDKGGTVAVHWRRARDQEAAEELVRRVTSEVADATGLGLERGKKVAELRPPVDWDKGTAIAAIADDHNLSEIVYFGDDLGDLAAFATVHARGGVAVAVDQDDETPPDLREVSDVQLPGPTGVKDWLNELAELLG